MNGTAYVIEQLGQALEASHNLIAQQQEYISQLETSLAEKESAGKAEV